MSSPYLPPRRIALCLVLLAFPPVLTLESTGDQDQNIEISKINPARLSAQFAPYTTTTYEDAEDRKRWPALVRHRPNAWLVTVTAIASATKNLPPVFGAYAALAGGHLLPVAIPFIAWLIAAWIGAVLVIAYILHRRPPETIQISGDSSGQSEEGELPTAEPEESAGVVEDATPATRLAMVFELEFHPAFGRHPDAELKRRAYQAFWRDIADGLDQWSFYKKVKDAGRFSVAEREEIIRHVKEALNGKS